MIYHFLVLSLLILLIVLLFLVFKKLWIFGYLKRVNEKIKVYEKEDLLGQVLMFKIYKFVVERIDKKENVHQVLKDLLHMISVFFGADAWSLLLTPEEKDWTFFSWSFSIDKKPLKEMALFLQKERPVTIKTVLETKKMFYIKDVSKFKDWKEIKEYKTFSWIGIPVVLDNKVYGILNLDYYKPKKLNRIEKRIINLVSKEISIVINHLFNLRDLIQDSYKDILTGVYNRKILQDEKLKDYKLFFFLDINGFKEINDKYGHLVGDEILKITAKRLKKIFKEEDIIIRYGGDEFLICLKEINNISISDIRKRIKEAISNEVKIENLTLRVSAAIGEFLRNEDEPINVVIRKADELMYKDKRKI